MGKKTFEFENKFKDYIDIKNAVAVNSGTAALHLSLKMINLKPQDEVIMPTITFASTAEVPIYFNAKPVLVDVERDTHLIDVAKIEEKITKNTRAIIPVHYGGQICDMNEIMDIAKKYKLYVIEDAAHSLPAWYKGNKIGGFGDMTCFSFYATKTLTTGEGGMITTNNDKWAERMNILRLHGISKDAWKRYDKNGSWEYDVIEAGFKYNTTDLNSAMGIEQLKKLEFVWEKRKRIAEKYTEAFKDVKELIPYKVKNDRVSSWHLYPIKLNLEALKINRKEFIELLKEQDISTSVHFIPLYRFSYYKGLGYDKQSFNDSEWVFKRLISLPIYPGMKDDEIDYVIGNMIELIKKYKR
jgi:perosamine synthetase